MNYSVEETCLGVQNLLALCHFFLACFYVVFGTRLGDIIFARSSNGPGSVVN